MSADKRLTQAYENATVRYFDENSKYVFFSDCHRGDDSVSDEFARNQAIVLSALRYYYNNEFVYVEAGDGDDLWQYQNFKYIRSAHMDVFTLLREFHKKDRLYMLYGNHNIYLKYRNYVKHNYFYFYDEYREKQEKLFYRLEPIEALLLKEKRTKQEILIVHGHQGDLLNDQLWILSMLAVRYFWRFMQLVGVRNPASPAKNSFKRHKMENKYTRWIKTHNRILICGHTHRMKYPKAHEIPYFNIGCCVHTKGITTIELEKNHISLIQWRMLADEEGIVRIMRKVIRGPEPIERWRQ